ncbi:hypothetical protein HNQ77_004323 [Silvibacterium bohemicum]|uniref:Alginate lyase domain-containing protein n=1 Tax=Silvibacterium bohemicum TaxID=1577686 RepID=A0A841K5D5_9BACT|nr:alginate lyase family protein [Silvibacterium bohemicum]MBB6146351.1 hypothetical protein [Silvibacterium bohemicum]
MRKLPVLLSLVLFTAAANAQKLRSAWDDVKVNATDAPYTCPAPPAFANTLSAEGYYTDEQYSVIDPAKLAAFNAASEGLSHLGQYAGLAADNYLAKGSKAAAACVYTLLDAAAKADAWDGKMPQINGVYLQNWMLSGAAIPYLKVRNSGVGTPQQDAEIQRWFARVSSRVQDYFDVQWTHPGSDAYNNHLYWAGLAVAAQGVAGNNRDAFLWGVAACRQGIESIKPDGSLAAEMNRAGMALHYQLYALGPLIMLAELGEANGIDMYGMSGGAIHRLVKFDEAALADPSIIAKRTGAKQEVDDPPSGLDIGWAVPYVKRFPDPQLSAMIAKAPWVRFWQWGGAPPEPQIPPPSPTPEQAAFEADLRSRVRAAMEAQFPSEKSRFAAFLGSWCGQGDPAVHASIVDSGAYLTLTNENGDASLGRAYGKDNIAAPGWESVTGILNQDRSQIDWSNVTFWERCERVKERPGSASLNLSGKWYAGSDRTQPCSIRQQNRAIHIACGKWGNASGQVDHQGKLSTDWSGKPIAGLVTIDGDHINWDNQTYWTRSSVYRTSNR